MNEEIITILDRSIRSASSDYYRWSQGRSIYEAGVEAVMEVYSAQELHKALFGVGETLLELQYPTHNLDVPILTSPNVFRHGRIDLFVRVQGEMFFIEFKRYLNQANIASDIERLVHLTNAAQAQRKKSTGLLAGIMYHKDGDTYSHKENYDGYLNGARALWGEKCIITSHVNDAVAILDTSEVIYADNQQRHVSIIIEVTPKKSFYA